MACHTLKNNHHHGLFALRMLTQYIKQEHIIDQETDLDVLHDHIIEFADSVFDLSRLIDKMKREHMFSFKSVEESADRATGNVSLTTGLWLAILYILNIFKIYINGFFCALLEISIAHPIIMNCVLYFALCFTFWMSGLVGGIVVHQVLGQKPNVLIYLTITFALLFYLHKFPLLSKSSRLQRLVASINEEKNDEVDISDIPGGPSAFEICAKFCYGMIVTLNAYNVLAARCAAEYLEMFETIDKGNLIYKIDVFLTSSVFRTWKDSIIVLQSTRSLVPWCEDLKVISHCIDSIASKASIDPSEVEWSYTYNRKKLPSENGIDSHWNGVRMQPMVPTDWWVEDLCELEVDSYKRVIMSIKAKGSTPAVVVGEALRAYAYRRLLGSLEDAVSNGVDCAKPRAVLDAIVSLLPAEEGSVSCGFLLKLLGAACLLESGESSHRSNLIKRIGAQLDGASVSDLLIIPPNTDENDTYSIDLVMAIVEEFMSLQNSDSGKEKFQDDEEIVETENVASVSSTSKLAVAKLIDGYLAEVAKDPNLPLPKLTALAEMVSSLPRPTHDGLYRAIDMYLKEHPSLSKSEKKKLCGLMDCKQLSHDACMHAVQNERLPLRVVVQVLFFEQ
ncbi:hypothetical protein ACJX0J_009717, partial [Zea mays]